MLGLATDAFLWRRDSSKCFSNSSQRRAWRPLCNGTGRVIRRSFSNQVSGDKPKKKAEGFLAMYSQWLLHRPILTKAVSSGIIVAFGDVLAQVLVEGALQEGHKYDWARTGRMWLIGITIVAPLLHYWYMYLNKWIPDPSTKGALLRVLIDQVTFAPVGICVFFTSIFTLEGRLDELPDHIRANLWPTLKNNWKLWIPTMFVTFRVIPHHYQVLWVNCVSVLWNTYMSWVGHQKEAKKP